MRQPFPKGCLSKKLNCWENAVLDSFLCWKTNIKYRWYTDEAIGTKISILVIAGQGTLWIPRLLTLVDRLLTLIESRAWEIGYTQPCINCRGKSATHFVYFWSRKTLPIHIWKPLHTFHSKVKAFPSEPLPIYYRLLQKISTLYNFYEWRV